MEEFLDGVNSTKFIVSNLVKKRGEIILQELVEFLKRHYYERHKDTKTRTGHRDGYETLKVETVEGSVEAYLPQIRDTAEPFHSKLALFFRSHSEIPERLAIELCH